MPDKKPPKRVTYQTQEPTGTQYIGNSMIPDLRNLGARDKEWLNRFISNPLSAFFPTPGAANTSYTQGSNPYQGTPQPQQQQTYQPQQVYQQPQPAYNPHPVQPQLTPQEHNEVMMDIARQADERGGDSDFMNTGFMQYYREHNVPLDRQLRWDENRKKFITVGKWMKEQQRIKQRKAGKLPRHYGVIDLGQ